MTTSDHDNTEETLIEGPDSSSHVLRNTVVADLGRRIVHGDIRSGARFTLDDIQGHYDVSRTVARDAMRILESMGLMYAKRRVGLIVTGVDQWRVLDPQVMSWRLSGPHGETQYRELIELRQAVDPLAAAGAAQNASREIKNEIIQLAGQLRDAADSGDMEELIRVDTAFHELIFTHSGNSLFRMSPVVLREMIRRGLTIDGQLTRMSDDMLYQHDALALAISSGSAERAREASAYIVNESAAKLSSKGDAVEG